MSNDSFSQMRLRNAESIISAVRDNAEISRADIARDTKLSPATVSSIVDELVKKDILHETGARSTALGRRPIGLVFNPKFGHLCGISIDANRVDLVLTDLNGNVVVELDSHCLLDTPAMQISELCMKLIKSSCRDASIPISSLGAVQLAVPGPVSKEPPPHKTVNGVFGVRELLARNLGIPVGIDSLVNMAAMAECAQGSPFFEGCTVYVRTGHALRSSIVVGGQLIAGKDNKAGELGHIVLPGRTSKCFCGNTGCLNSIVSLPAFLEKCHKSGIKLGGEADFVDLLEENGFADLLADTAECMAFGISSLVNLLAPDAVVISAPYFSCGAAFQKPLMQSLEAHCSAELLMQCKVVCKQPRSGVEAYGAALTALGNTKIIELLKARL